MSGKTLAFSDANSVLVAAVGHGHMLEVFMELRRDFFHRQDEINQAGADGAAHHAVIFGTLLRQGKTAALLDGPKPDRAIAARAGQDDACRTIAAHEIVADIIGIDFREYAGFAYAAYLLYVQIAVIDAICVWCVASDVVVAVLAVLAATRAVTARP